MTSAWSQLEQMLTCAICLDKFKNPRLLPCQHSFCGDACMEGLVDYARRQIKCPECRAEHRIPYQGISSLPSNVTLIRFLELHSRITGEEPEPVPTFMEKCSVCGEKVEGVARCWHCEKKVCPECKEAHLDLLRREIARVNGQTKRCLSRLQEFHDSMEKAADRLGNNRRSIKQEIEGSTRRLLEDIQVKQRKLCEEVDAFAEQELHTIERLKLASVEELETMESNLKLAEEKLANKQFAWTDQELAELREIYTKAMEFMRLFEPDLGDFSRKIRFSLIPEFETMRRRLCEIGELKFSESVTSQMANALTYCNATGPLAQELCQQAASCISGANGLNPLSQSGSSSNLQAGGMGVMLELPGGMQNSLMRSQSDHRLASQFQQRLKREQQQQKDQIGTGAGIDKNGTSNRYGIRDYETDSLRSRYAPPRSSVLNSAQDSLLTRDWPRPSDSSTVGASDSHFGSSIHFKSAFMRRKEKERQQAYGAGDLDDDDDLASEASSSYLGSRNVRFHEPSSGLSSSDQLFGRQQQVASVQKLFDVSIAERAPLSGIPRLEQLPYLLARLHEIGARAIIDKKNAEEEGKRDKDLLESARQSVSRASERRPQHQASEDEIEKQKRANRAPAEQQHVTEVPAPVPVPSESLESQQPAGRAFNTTVNQTTQPSDNSVAASSRPEEPTVSTPSSPATTASSARRSLYGQAVTEKSRRQLSSAVQEAATYSRRRAALSTPPAEDSSVPVSTSSPAQSQETPQPESTGTGNRPKRAMRSSTRSISRQSSADQSNSGLAAFSGDLTPTIRRGKRLANRADSAKLSSTSQDNSSNNQPKNSTGSGDATHSEITQSSDQLASAGQQQPLKDIQRRETSLNAQASTATTDQTSPATTDDENDDDDDEKMEDVAARQRQRIRVRETASYRATQSSNSSESNSSAEDADADENNGLMGGRNLGNRRSRELLPNAVNKLLDRSAQIRRDSQEQRTRAASPQRPTQSSSNSSRHSTRDFSSPSGSSSQPVQSSFYSSNRAATSGYSSPVSSRSQRPLAYQRTQSIQQDNDNSAETTNSNNSIYTTASSSATRRSSTDTENMNEGRGGTTSGGSSSRRLSGNSSDRTLISANSDHPRASAYMSRRDSSTDSPSLSSSTVERQPYQSRFLSRSRTSAALSSTGSTSSPKSSVQAQEEGDAEMQSPRSYLSSRDRFMQSAALMSSTSSPSSAHTGYSRGGSSSSSSAALPISVSKYPRFSQLPCLSNLGQNRYHPSSRANYNNDSPFVVECADDYDDDDDDEESTHFSSASQAPFSLYAGPATKHPLIQKYLYWPLLRDFTSKQPPAKHNVKQGASSVEANNSSLLNKPSSTASSKSYTKSPSSVYSRILTGGSKTLNFGRYTSGSGLKTHSEYLRNKYSRRSSSSSSALSKSRSFHASTSRNLDSNDDDEDDDNPDENSNNNNEDDDDLDDAEKLARGSHAATTCQSIVERQRVRSRRSSLASSQTGSFDSSSNAAGCTRPRSIYSGKRRMLFKLGSRGPDPGNFTWPRGVAVGSGAHGLSEIVVADSSNHRVQIFDLDGKFLNEFGSYGSAPGEFDCLAGVAINRVHKNYVVSDRYNHRIQVFDMTGKFVRTFGELGREPGKFNLPWGVACDPSGLIYVCDKENHRIQVFDVDGTRLSKFGTCGTQAGQLQHPHYIAVGMSKVVVTDTNNHRVQVFDLGGRLISSIGREGSLAGQFKFPRGIAMDDLGNLIVGDSGNNRLQIFTPDGTFLKSIGTWGSADGEFKGIEGVAVDSRHNILVCDRENHRIQVF